MAVTVLNAGLKFTKPLQKRSRTDYIALHHAAASTASVEAVHNWHLQRGFSGIGYHYYIRKDGTVYRGRPEDAIGAHVYGYNSVSIGVCAEGDYTKETMPAPQKEALISLVKDLKKRYPNARIVGHKDLVATACPGNNFPLEEMKNIKEDDSVYLKQGMSGAEVKTLQENLIKLGYGKYLEPYGVDGKFGEKTKRAVEAFQKDNSLTVDGIAGPLTLGKIEELLKKDGRIRELELELQKANAQIASQNVQLSKYKKAIDSIKQIINNI